MSEQEKHYYMLLTFPGFGTRAVVAMKSGTKLKGTEPGGFKFWFQQLVEYGIGTAEDEEALSKVVWQVILQPMLSGIMRTFTSHPNA